ncbi:MAG: hypothetical protein M1319_06925 [Chloroflexi bacterium]|nr:hypothetical protein [Chloroflexota bacterium]
MKAHKSLRLALLSVVVATVILVSFFCCGPSLIDRLSPQPALAEELPPEVLSTDVQATGTLHTLTVPAIAFQPIEPGLDYFNGMSDLYLHTGSGRFGAPVYLPQGAKVVRLVAFCSDNTSSYSLSVTLDRGTPNAAGYNEMAKVASSDSATVQKLIDNTVSYPTINNSSYVYFLYASLTGPNVTMYSIKIVYYY